METEESTIVEEHIACPDCGSHDAMCRYSDGHTYCFSCNQYHKGDGELPVSRPKVARNVIAPCDLRLEPLPKRLITEETCRKYGYYKGFLHNKGAQFANYVDDDGTIIGQKVRYADKTFETLGTVGNRFFGQHLWSGGGRKLIITEGAKPLFISLRWYSSMDFSISQALTLAA